MAVTWLKRGKEGRALTKRNDEDVAAKRAAAANKTFRFFLKEGEEKRITFLDGELDEAGVLDVPRYWEHRIKMNGHWNNWYPCTKDEEEDCPLCDDGQPSLVYVFTIIDHTEWTSEQKSVDHVNERKLYICKSDTYKRLSKIAHKRDGLTGCSFDVGRIGEKAEAAGNDFDFVKKQTLAKVAKKYDLKKKGEDTDNKVALPYDYDKVLKYYPADELREMGLGGSDKDVPGSKDAKELKNKSKKKKKDKKKKDKKKKDKKKKDKSKKKKKDKVAGEEDFDKSL